MALIPTVTKLPRLTSSSIIARSIASHSSGSRISGLRFLFSNHDLTPHLQNYRNHLQNLRLLGAQIVVPIVLQGASGRRLSVLRQRHACGVSGHRSANACLSAYPGTLPACSGCLPAAFGSSVPFRRHDGVRLPVGSHTPGRSSVGMRTAHQRRTVLRRDGHSIDHRN